MSAGNHVDGYYTVIPKLESASESSELLNTTYKRIITGFSFIYPYGNGHRTVSVHRGFLTNGESLPLAARYLLKEQLETGLDHPAIILHDWLCEYLLIEEGFKCIPINRFEVIEIFIKALNLTNLTIAQITFIKMICIVNILFKGRNRNRPELIPYKRYVEDKSYTTIN